MTPFYTDDWLTLYGGDCKAVLAELPADSVDCVVTSPPYWGLRDYGTAVWIGGDAACPHEPSQEWIDHNFNANSAFGAGAGTQSAVAKGKWYRSDGSCRCGATRQDSQLGLERTPEEYVANMVAVFAEVRRVLKPSGTCWLNLGDSYAGSWGANGRGEGTNSPRPDLEAKHGTNAPNRNPPGLKPKDLVGIPWRVAFALQADGWYLRSDIIWSKPNPMPESVTDRPTKAHEYLFLLTKSARYYFDADAVREAVSPHSDFKEPAGITPWSEGVPRNDKTRLGNGSRGDPSGRNIRSVWTIATRPYPGAHFAVFPPELPERCIKAGSSERGVCPECGAPWERVVERVPVPRDLTVHRGTSQWAEGATTRNDTDLTRSGQEAAKWKALNPDKVLGWRPTCSHYSFACSNQDHEHPIRRVAPAVVLDPFAGSGTVGMVANRLSRRAILIDLNPEYLVQQMKRNAQTPLGLTEGDAA